MSMVQNLAIWLLMASSCTYEVKGDVIYKKFFHRTLKNSVAYASFGIQKMFECEIICSEHGLKCQGANFYYHGPRNYVCELMEHIPAGEISDDHLTPTKYSKFMAKIGR